MIDDKEQVEFGSGQRQLKINHGGQGLLEEESFSNSFGFGDEKHRDDKIKSKLHSPPPKDV